MITYVGMKFHLKNNVHSKIPKEPEIEIKKPEPVKKVAAAPTVRFLGPKRDDMVNPKWIEDDEALGDGKIKKIPKKEVTFFKDLIQEYLKPSHQVETKVSCDVCVRFSYSERIILEIKPPSTL